MNESEALPSHTQATTEHAAPTGPIGAFGLNGTLFTAQLINFAIVMVILWRFVYRPLLATMNERTRRIEESLKNATMIEAAKAELKAEKERAVNEARTEASVLLQEAKTKATTMIEAARDRATHEVTEIVTQARLQIAGERELMREEAKQEMLTLAAAIAEKFLEEKASSKQDLQLLQGAMKHLMK